MISYTHSCLLLGAAFGLTFQMSTEGQRITTEEARVALNKLMESKSFLSDAPYMEPLKKRILAENKKDPILKTYTSSSAPGGNFIGPWGVEISTNEFSYYAKSAGKDELFTIRGNFLFRQENQWNAQLSEVSVTKLTNFFAKRELEKIQEGMSINEVTTILGGPPGAYFAGVMGFTYPAGRRANWPFTGTDKEFQRQCKWFFEAKPNGEKEDWIDRAWISNDIAIYITFDKDRRVDGIHSSEVRSPNDQGFFSEFFEKMMRELKKPDSPKGC